MRQFVPITTATLALVACAGRQPVQSPAVGTEAVATRSTPSTPSPAPEGAAESGDPGEANQFVLQKSDTAKNAQGVTPSKIKPTETEAAMKFIVLDKDKGPVAGIVISLTAPNGRTYYTEETDAQGYAEVLVPAGQKYDLVYLTLGRRDIAVTVSVTNEPNQNIKLTLRYKRQVLPNAAPGAPGASRFVLEGVNFDTGKATIRAESFPRLDRIVEYMTHKKNSRIEISGHTDNVGNPKANKVLSEKRAQACRNYLISKGIDKSRIEAVGYGDQRPMASNDTDEGRQKNRRIEATEL
jgi:outer membrane protein OmpA-like peptidoglycan-associated protein